MSICNTAREVASHLEKEARLNQEKAAWFSAFAVAWRDRGDALESILYQRKAYFHAKLAMVYLCACIDEQRGSANV